MKSNNLHSLSENGPTRQCWHDRAHGRLPGLGLLGEALAAFIWWWEGERISEHVQDGASWKKISPCSIYDDVEKKWKNMKKLCLTEQNHVQIHLVAKAKFVQWFLKTDVQKPGFWVSYDFWDLSQKQKKSLDAQKPWICTVVFKNRCTESAILQSSDFTWFPTINHVKLYMGKKKPQHSTTVFFEFWGFKIQNHVLKTLFLGGGGGQNNKTMYWNSPPKIWESKTMYRFV